MFKDVKIVPRKSFSFSLQWNLTFYHIGSCVDFQLPSVIGIFFKIEKRYHVLSFLWKHQIVEFICCFDTASYIVPEVYLRLCETW